jgi:hypothetical protein
MLLSPSRLLVRNGLRISRDSGETKKGSNGQGCATNRHVGNVECFRARALVLVMAINNYQRRTR